MPCIRPISNLKNYKEILKEVDANKRVYLTRKGLGAYAIMSVEEADELDKLKSMLGLISDLKQADKEANQAGWIKADELENDLGIYD